MCSYNFSTISIKNVLITNGKLKMFINSVIRFNFFSMKWYKVKLSNIETFPTFAIWKER